jgi:hypothetical protein
MIHYKRLQNGRMASVNVLERLWTKAVGDADDECWEYHGSTSIAGHTRIRLDDKSRMMVHRMAWEAHHAEPIPEGMQVNHHCDNPICFNPAHLYLGTQKQNMEDRFRRGRANLKRKVSLDDRELIKCSTEPNKLLAERYGVTTERISQIKKGR